jgi:hypothetical protein
MQSNTNSHTNNKDNPEVDAFLRSIVRTPRQEVKRPIRKPIIQAVSTEYIAKAVRKSYKVDLRVDENDRIVDAIEHLTRTYPKQMIPLPLVFWMCHGGKNLKRADTEEILRFGRKVSRAKKKMIVKHRRTFFIKAGMVRGLVDREEHATDELPKANKRLAQAYHNAQAVAGIVGNPDTLKMTEETREAIESAKKTIPVLDRMASVIRGLLPPAPTGK